LKSDSALRKHVLDLLRGGHAHLGFERITAGLPAKLRAAKHARLPHSPWQLVEHLRIAQWDILEFSRNPKHVSPEWPEGYWPAIKTPTESAWRASRAAFLRDLQQMQDLVADPKTDLFAVIPWSDGATILGEALLVADHNAYHLGQLVTLRRLLGAWK
jgi:hypothetical protein